MYMIESMSMYNKVSFKVSKVFVRKFDGVYSTTKKCFARVERCNDVKCFYKFFEMII